MTDRPAIDAGLGGVSGVKRWALLIAAGAVCAALGQAAGQTPAVQAPAGQAPRPAAADAGETARRAQIEGVRAAVLGADRARRVAAFEAATAGNDPALRRAAFDAALESRDPTLGALALRQWLARAPATPVLLYALKEEAGSAAVLQNLGPLTFTPQSLDIASGAVVGRLSAPGYEISRDGAAAGTLAQTTLTINTYACQLALQLTEHRTLDGLYRCRSLPALAARIVLD